MKIYEQYFLLCLNSNGKIVIDKPVFYTGFVGAIVFDLVLAERVKLTGPKLSIRRGTGELDAVLEKSFKKIEQQLAGNEWIELSVLINKMDPIVVELKQLTSQNLVDKKIIETRKNGLFRRMRYVMMIPSVKSETVFQLVQSVRSHSSNLRDIMLISLVEACELIPTMMPDGTMRKAFMSDLKAWKKTVSLAEVDEINISIKSIQPQLMVNVISSAITSVINTTSVGVRL